LGVQSYCFRAFSDHAQLIEALNACGVDRVELYPGHYDPVTEPDPAAVIQTFADAGITISSFGVYRFGDDEVAARKVFDFAQAAGFPTISADLAPGGLAVVEKLCAETGKKVAIHNHGRKHELGPVSALERLFAETSLNVGLCLDTAWMLDSGEDPVAVARRFQNRLYVLHIKDFVFDRAGRPEDVIVGTGNLDLVGLAASLTDIAFDGYLTLEYEGDVDNPVPATKQCVEAVWAAFARLG
jgi:sugar phosphate isomerase/epimerase